MPDKGYGYTWENGSRQPMLIITTAVLILCSTITVALRLYCRLTFVRHIGIDDKFMIGAWLFAVGLGIQNVLCVYWGTGRRTDTLDSSVMLIPTFKHWYAYQIVYPWALFFIKASILALYHRIFTQTRFRYIVYAMASFITIQTIVVTFVNAFECGSEPWRAWSPTFPAGCNNLFATYFSMAAINILTDIIVLIMPIPAFKQLNLPRSKRYALLGVFLVGGVAVIASIVRLYALWLYAVSKDVPYDMIFILLLSQIEVNAAIISASAPALRPLIIKTFTSSSHGRSEPYAHVIGSDGPSSKILGRSARSRSNGPVELFSFGGNNRTSKVTVRGTRSTSEESILGVEATGITRTIETKIEEDCVKQSGDGQYVGAQGYDGPRRSDV